MHIQRILIISFGILGIISTFLPWVETKTFLVDLTVNGTDGDGWFTFVLFSICVAIAFISSHNKSINGTYFWICIICSVLAGLIVTIDIMNASNNLDNFVGSILASSIHIGIGIYLIIFSSIAIPISMLLTKNR
jgi:hypothetical protein